MGLRFWIVPLMFCVASAGMAQQGAAPGVQQEPNHPELAHRPAPSPANGEIRLDVVVTDGAGRAVPGLQQQDFTLLDDKKPQPITSFRAVDGTTGQVSGTVNGAAADPPVEVILLIDATNNSLHNIAFERSQVATFLRQNGGRLQQPVTLMIFSERGVRVQPRPSMDGNMIALSLDKAESTMHTVPRSGGYDAIERRSLSIRTLQSIAAAETPKPGRKMLLWIGPGWPMLQSSAYQESSNVQRNLFNVIVEITRELREARITLYSINPLDPENMGGISPDLYKGFLKAVPSVDRADSGDLALPVFAIHSGGLVLNEGDDLVRQLNSCMADAAAYYTISFRPPNAKYTDEFHEVEVKVSKPHLKTRTSMGYYSEPLPK